MTWGSISSKKLTIVAPQGPPHMYTHTNTHTQRCCHIGHSSTMWLQNVCVPVMSHAEHFGM